MYRKRTNTGKQVPHIHRGPGANIPQSKFDAFYHYSFVEFLSQHQACRLAKISRETGRGIHRDIRRYKALGETHPRLKKKDSQNAKP